jgi:hypothetical protein
LLFFQLRPCQSRKMSEPHFPDSSCESLMKGFRVEMINFRKLSVHQNVLRSLHTVS